MEYNKPPRETRHLHFLGLVATGPVTDCWLWAGRTMSAGYGIFGNDLAHRYSYELLIGEIAGDMTIDHLCMNRRCVNPNHMEVVTRAENTRRGINVRPRKTHCKNGHRFDLENTYYRKDNGARMCRACASEQGKRTRLKKKNAA